ncbi:unnamed protein product [Protopolystoma xenopodis]|uniref:Uncharacterized protein n=1 Tax=Protopolystoma xenopodis TaxID=117903 RepID=A0A448XFK3_9PLAT|nr:unnamed protein product [Protopolystoma xenopodis]
MAQMSSETLRDAKRRKGTSWQKRTRIDHLVLEIDPAGNISPTLRLPWPTRYHLHHMVSRLGTLFTRTLPSSARPTWCWHLSRQKRVHTSDSPNHQIPVFHSANSTT